MIERPAPVRDLDWDAKRARAFADRTVDLWAELLERLEELPVARRWTAQQVHDAVAIPIPEEPTSDDDLFSYLREVVFEWSGYCGHPRFMFVVRLHLVKRDRDGKRGQASPNAGTRYRRPNYLRCSHSFRNATATANALKNAKMVANIG